MVQFTFSNLNTLKSLFMKKMFEKGIYIYD